MTTEQLLLVAAGAVALVALLVAALSWQVARRSLARTQEYAALLAERETTPAARPPAPEDRDVATYVITGLGQEGPSGEDVAGDRRGSAPERIEGRLFADIVLRETVVKAAAWTHGVRRALDPETRNRIRFQVRQQAKQARRDRRAEVREALREYRARRGAAEQAEGDAA